ncbi:hypothetical protein, partial [Vibrio rotiferianus]|uniref:hypothetical protein n=1 Tax=Vibrio rotiferianus TaxID=190895 RepID=UPI0005F02C44
DHATTHVVVITESSRIQYTASLIVLARLAFYSFVIERDYIAVAIAIFCGKALLVQVELTVVTKQVYKALLDKLKGQTPQALISNKLSAC